MVHPRGPSYVLGQVPTTPTRGVPSKGPPMIKILVIIAVILVVIYLAQMVLRRR